MAILTRWLEESEGVWPNQRARGDDERVLALWVKSCRRESPAVQAAIQELKERFPVAAAGRVRGEQWLFERLGALELWLEQGSGVWPSRRADDEAEKELAVWVINASQHPAEI